MNIDEIKKMHIFEMLRNGSGNGECSPFPFGNPICGWIGHYSEHANHIAEVIRTHVGRVG